MLCRDFILSDACEPCLFLFAQFIVPYPVTPLPNHVLQVDFVSGSRLLLDMKPYLDKIRFRPLADARVWNSAVTNGIFVRFGNVELSHDEILSMAEQEHNSPNI